jgi:FixJ family two-component response regulator
MAPASIRASSESPAILIVDDEQSILSLCRDLAEDCGWKAQTASTTDQALSILEKKKIDCLITDLRVPSEGGMNLIKKVRTAYPSTRIIVLTQYGKTRDIVEAMQLGARDFIEKPFVIEDFQEKLGKCSEFTAQLGTGQESQNKGNRFREVRGVGIALYDSNSQSCLAVNQSLAQARFFGHKHFNATQVELRPVASLESGKPNLGGRASVALTMREIETLILIAKGNCNKEIANSLRLSPKTVDTYRQRIMSKLDLHNLSDLIHYAIRNGLVKS